ncbi:MAG: M48 family metalloprotease [Alphaproteobacteria bacterium]|nr:M48 family metalloprotease [Alphaproteobacteria bacterium]
MSSFILLASFLLVGNLQAQTIIYDEETESFIQKLSVPLFRSANIPFNRNNVYILSDESLNAFVADGNLLFINTGTIVRAGSDDELRGVIAHEIGHIQGGHILRGKLKAQQLSEAGLASMLVAGAAAIASGRGDVGMALMLGSQSSMMNNYLNYRVQEERSADEAGVRLLNDNQISPQGMRNFMKKIEQENLATGVSETPYFRTHPVTKERISFIEEATQNSPYKQVTQTEEFRRVKAKLYAFIYPPEMVFAAYGKGQTIVEKYALAIVNYRIMQKKKAIALIDELISLEPNNPFFHELKAQIYLETGNVKQAKTEYKKALSLLPTSNLFMVSLAQATLEDEPTQAELIETERNLNKVVIVQPTYEAWLLLARTYAMRGKMTEANYASAESSLRLGQFDAANKQLDMAKKGNPTPALSLKIADLENRIKDAEKDAYQGKY